VETKTKDASSKSSKLNPKQELFIREYLKDFNGTQAAIRAGYPKHRARFQATQALSNPHIELAISTEMLRRTAKVEVDVEFVLKELLQIANCDVAEAFEENGGLKSIHDIPTPIRKTISSFEVEEIWEMQQDEDNPRRRHKVQIGELKKVKFWDKKGSLELLGKYLAMFVERQRFEDKDGQPLPPVQVQFIGVLPEQQASVVPSGRTF
jgi:phage terminase small subunit